MKKFVFATLGLTIMAVGYFVMTRMPFPDSSARDAIGKPVKISTPKGPIVYYESGSGPCIFLFPSAGREASDFNELVLALNSSGYHTVALEAGGVNKSALYHAEFIYSAAFTLNIVSNKTCYSEPVAVIGHAYGNRVVQVFSNETSSVDGFDVSILTYPTANANVSNVILLTAGGQVASEPEIDAALKRIFSPLETYKSRMKDVRTAFFAEGNDIPEHWTRGWHTKTALAQGKSKGRGGSDDSWYCAGGVPILIVQPMQDKIAPPADAYALKDKCPQDVEIVEVKNAGHALLPEQPEDVADAVLAFLAKRHPVN